MTLEEKLAIRLAREPANEPCAREIATSKLLISEAHRMGDDRITLLNIRQLINLSKSRFEENKVARRTVERSALQGCEQVFCLCLQTVFWGYPDSAVLPPLVANGPFDYDGEGVSIMLHNLFASEERASQELGEVDFYVDADAPDRAEYEKLLLAEEPSRFREIIALIHLMYGQWFKAGDRILVEACSKALTQTQRAARILDEWSLDWHTPADLQLAQEKLVAWISQIPEQSGTAELWRSDILKLCANFADCVRFIIVNRSTAADRATLLDKFIMPGASTCYPMLYPEGWK